MPELPKDAVHALVDRWAGGEDEALTDLFGVYFRKVVGLLADEGHFIEDAQDVVQEVFINLHRHLQAGGRKPEKLTFYLVTCARTIVRQARNYNKRRKPLPIDHGVDIHREVSHQLPSSVRSVASSVGSLEMRNILREAIDRLPDCYRKVYLLRLQGLKEREIAERLGIAVGTVKGYVHGGLERLKDDLDEVARKMSTCYAQSKRGEELTPVAILQAAQKIPWLYGDPVRLKHFEGVSDAEGAKKLGLAMDVYHARLAEGYALLENELGVEFPAAFEAATARGRR